MSNAPHCPDGALFQGPATFCPPGLLLPLAVLFFPIPAAMAPAGLSSYPPTLGSHTGSRVIPSFLTWLSRPLDLTQLILQDLNDIFCETGPPLPTLSYLGPPYSPTGAGVDAPPDGETGVREANGPVQGGGRRPQLLQHYFSRSCCPLLGRSWLMEGLQLLGPSLSLSLGILICEMGVQPAIAF